MELAQAVARAMLATGATGKEVAATAARAKAMVERAKEVAARAQEVAATVWAGAWQ